MFAVLKTGGKQYKVTSGDVIKVEKLAANQGETVQFNDILLIQGKKDFCWISINHGRCCASRSGGAD